MEEGNRPGDGLEISGGHCNAQEEYAMRKEELHH